MRIPLIPLWLKVSYTLMVAVIVPLYTLTYGLSNFLWFSDVALLVLVPALWMESKLLNSMMAVGVLPFEFIWLIGFFTGGAFLGIAGYMFSDQLPLWLRALSGFHFVMPATIIFLLYRLGYDPQALSYQICLALVICLITFFFTDPAKNINWISGPGYVQNWMSPGLYFAIGMVTLPVIVYLPMHFLLKRLF